MSEMGGGAGGSGEDGGGPQKKRGIDDIIEHMTADLQSYEGQYILLGQPGSSHHLWASTPPVSHHHPTPHQIFYQAGNGGATRVPAPPEHIPQQDMISMVELGRNYVVFSKPPQPQPTPPPVSFIYQHPHISTSHLIDYTPRGFPTEGSGCLIENVVGNWAPNLNGTYSPFGGLHKDEHLTPQSSLGGLPPPPQTQGQGLKGLGTPGGGTPNNAFTQQDSYGQQQPQQMMQNQQQQQQPVKKQRIVAEVKPTRPSYSDVLAKSPPLTPPPQVKQAVKPLGNSKESAKSPEPKQRHHAKSNSIASGDSLKGSGSLKRQSSSGSDDGLGGGSNGKWKVGGNAGLGERWSSMEDLSGLRVGGGGSAGVEGTKGSTTPSVNNLGGVFTDQENIRRRRKHRSTNKPSLEKEEKYDLGKGAFLDRNPVNCGGGGTQGGSSSGKKSSGGYGFGVNNNLGGDEGDGGESEGSEEAATVSNQQSRINSSSSASTNPLGKSKRKNDDRKGCGAKSERPSNPSRSSNVKNKRSQRAYKKRESNLGALFKKWKEQSSYYIVLLTTWLLNLLWDVTAMSASLLIHMCGVVYDWILLGLGTVRRKAETTWRRWSNKKGGGKSNRRSNRRGSGGSEDDDEEDGGGKLPRSLANNIQLPTTGEEAMKRLLSCKGKDPYSILGVTSTCTDEEIKKYYKSQALLVHPDKNSQPGAEEAFKILVHAFDLIAEPEKRAAYDRYVAETNQVEQAWSELSDLLSQLHEKMEYAANTIRCNNCGKRHKREMTERPSYAARYCAQCKIHHAAKEGDMWAESKLCGWVWRYYACMGGAVYDITEWAHCQSGGVHSLKPDSHLVQYRVLLGRHPQPEPDFEELLNSLYSPNGQGKRGKKKPKKNK